LSGVARIFLTVPFKSKGSCRNYAAVARVVAPVMV
jgi:hypothetical protein